LAVPPRFCSPGNKGQGLGAFLGGSFSNFPGLPPKFIPGHPVCTTNGSYSPRDDTPFPLFFLDNNYIFLFFYLNPLNRPTYGRGPCPPFLFTLPQLVFFFFLFHFCGAYHTPRVNGIPCPGLFINHTVLFQYLDPFPTGTRLSKGFFHFSPQGLLPAPPVTEGKKMWSPADLQSPNCQHPPSHRSRELLPVFYIAGGVPPGHKALAHCSVG